MLLGTNYLELVCVFVCVFFVCFVFRGSIRVREPRQQKKVVAKKKIYSSRLSSFTVRRLLALPNRFPVFSH